MAKPLSKPKSLKAQITRTSLVAAAFLLRERGPGRPSPIARWQNGQCGLVLGGLLFDSVTELPLRSGLLTLNCGSPVPRRWLQAAVPSAPRNVASAWSTFCWACLPKTTRYPCPPICLSSSPQPKRRWLPGLPQGTRGSRCGREPHSRSRRREPLLRSSSPSSTGAVKAISGYDVREIARMLLELLSTGSSGAFSPIVSKREDARSFSNKDGRLFAASIGLRGVLQIFAIAKMIDIHS